MNIYTLQISFMAQGIVISYLQSDSGMAKTVIVKMMTTIGVNQMTRNHLMVVDENC